MRPSVSTGADEVIKFSRYHQILYAFLQTYARVHNVGIEMRAPQKLRPHLEFIKA